MRRTRATDGPFTFRLDDATRTQLETIARAHKVTLGLLIRKAIADQLPDWIKKGVHLGNGK